MARRTPNERVWTLILAFFQSPAPYEREACDIYDEYIFGINTASIGNYAWNSFGGSGRPHFCRGAPNIKKLRSFRRNWWLGLRQLFDTGGIYNVSAGPRIMYGGLMNTVKSGCFKASKNLWWLAEHWINAFGLDFAFLPRDAIHRRGHCRRALSVRPSAVTQLQTQLHSYKHVKSEDRVVFFEICSSPEKGWVLCSPVEPHLRTVSVASNATRRLLRNRVSPLTFKFTPSWQKSESLWRRSCLQNVTPSSCWQRFRSVSFTLATELLYSASVKIILTLSVVNTNL